MVIWTPVGIALSGILSDIIRVNWCFVLSGIGMMVVAIIYFKISITSQKYILQTENIWNK
ncbi:MAG: hypothetical protein RSA29_03590 [Clostridium sp.]|uniref:hypothetical protein n=1 Tax=Clostridium sp. TaxID=1506 RepID=UPI0030729374